MISVNGKELRTLTEQVLKNKEDIAAHYNADRVLADFGIRVLGEKATEADLPDPATFVGEYGDAYAVGTAAPYTFYIWTRPNPNDGHDAAYWMNIGPLAIVGPQGPQGDKGDTGDTGPKGAGVYARAKVYDGSTDLPEGSTILLTTTYGAYTAGDIVKFDNVSGVSTITKIGSIRGSVGPQGPKGDSIVGPPGPKGDSIVGPPGPAGPIVDVMGKLANVDQLPDPATVPRSAAYLVADGDLYDVYLITGPDNNLSWTNAGKFTTGSIVEVGGNPVSVVNLDNYYSKELGTDQTSGLLYRTSATDPLKCYPVDVYKANSGNPSQLTANSFNVVYRDAYGNIAIPSNFGTTAIDPNTYNWTNNRFTQDTAMSLRLYLATARPETVLVSGKFTPYFAQYTNTIILPNENFDETQYTPPQEGSGYTVILYNAPVNCPVGTSSLFAVDGFIGPLDGINSLFGSGSAVSVWVKDYDNNTYPGYAWIHYGDQNTYFCVSYLASTGRVDFLLTDMDRASIAYSEAMSSGEISAKGKEPFHTTSYPTQYNPT